MAFVIKMAAVFISLGVALTATPAGARIDDNDMNELRRHSSLYSDPQQINFETQFCSPNLYEPFYGEMAGNLSQVCWLRSKFRMVDGEYPEGLQVTWKDGSTHLYFLSTFVFDQQASRTYGSQILRAIIQGQKIASEGPIPSLSYVYKEYRSDSGIGRESLPDQILGTLPSGERFLIKRPQEGNL